MNSKECMNDLNLVMLYAFDVPARKPYELLLYDSSRISKILNFNHWVFPVTLSSNFCELLTNAMCLLSGDHEGTLIVPCPP